MSPATHGIGNAETEKKCSACLDGGFPGDINIGTMPLLRKLSSLREREHSSQGTLGHKTDKTEGEARSAEHWLLLPPLVDPHQTKRDFSRVPGRDYVVMGGTLKAVTPAEFVAFLNAEHKCRSRYRRSKKRGIKRAECWIKSKGPVLVETTVTLSPWSSDFFLEGAAVAPEKVAEVLAQFGSDLIAEIEKETGCKVIGMTVHTDTDDPHLNFQLARVFADEDGVMRLCDRRGLGGMAGPWMTAVDRQLRAGIRYAPHDDKYARALDRWQARYPGKDLPVDIGIARLLDALVEKLFGPLMGFKAAYRARIQAQRCEAITGRAEALRRELRQLETVFQEPSQHKHTTQLTR